ncbi:zinc finger protein 782-like [Diaphorina citri]|uniref:Zinc finger protein 782-like n=1 Tax=Diaphorina citri TaxID=121845 RepID=A0A3Q0IKZ7_DIACI|nr:zinc finger protein 782-like [Diaphorina citri]
MPRPNIYKCKYVCYMCPYHAYQVVQMRAHIFSHMGEKPYKCNLCDFSCTLKSNLNKHLRIKHHLDTKNCISPPPSHYLGPPFITKIMLSKFISTDFPKYRYQCTHCNQFETFLLDEIIEHGKCCSFMPRPNAFKCKYVCYMCTYGAYQYDQIRAHIFGHTGEKPFKCPHCSYASARNSHLLAHIRTKHS